MDRAFCCAGTGGGSGQWSVISEGPLGRARLPPSRALLVCRDLAFVIASWSSCFTVARGPAIGVGRVRFWWGGYSPAEALRRREVYCSCHFSASLRLCGIWVLLLLRGVPVSARRGRWVSVTEPVLGGRSMGFSPCRSALSPNWSSVARRDTTDFALPHEKSPLLSAAGFCESLQFRRLR